MPTPSWIQDLLAPGKAAASSIPRTAVPPGIDWQGFQGKLPFLVGGLVAAGALISLTHHVTERDRLPRLARKRDERLDVALDRGAEETLREDIETRQAPPVPSRFQTRVTLEDADLDLRQVDTMFANQFKHGFAYTT